MGVYSDIEHRIPLWGICDKSRAYERNGLNEKTNALGRTDNRNRTCVMARRDIQMEDKSCCGHHQKLKPRSEKELKQLKNRLSRMTGQLNGISKMLDENRYCGDILTQVAAVESALQAFGYMVLKTHMETCVAEEIQNGNLAVMDETVELIKKLK